ncbi:MAG TPA: hypothetical protein ENK26_00315, partial [Gammaproteobacteria bacterium]|nr:hypothetical protein [Gammaproteobacteria bacterium]
MKTKRRTLSRRNTLSFYAIFPLAGLFLFAMVDFFRAEDAGGAEAGGPILTLIRAMLYLGGGLFLLRGFKRNLNWFGSRLELMACMLYVLASVTWTTYPDRVIINFLHFLGSSIVVYVAAKYFVRNPQQLFPFFSILFGIVATLSLL